MYKKKKKKKKNILFLSSGTSYGRSHICDFAIELQETLSEAISHKETAVSAANELTQRQQC